MVKQIIEEKKNNFKIIAISNRYKDILDGFINKSDPESLLISINKGLCNMSRSKSSLIVLLKEACLDKDISALKRLLQLMPKTQNS